MTGIDVTEFMELFTCPHGCGHKCSTKKGSGVHATRCAKNPNRKVWSRTKPLYPGNAPVTPPRRDA